jgi:serine/threonine protein kinase
MDSRTATLLLRRAIDQGLLDANSLSDIKRASPAERADALLDKLRATGVGAEGLAWMVHAANNATRTPEIPGYHLGALIGWGAAGGVWRAVQGTVGREIALKVVPLGRSADATGFIAEVHALGRLNHPQVVTCHDAGTTGDRLYLAMEMMMGGDAEQLRRAAGGRLDETRALSIVRDAALGLAAIAGAGLVHRDLKPANLLLTAEGRAKIGDLGLARPSGPANGASWAVQGTPAFWSPEQVRGEALDVRSDIHALGATLYTLLCGQSPYTSGTILELIRAISERQVPDPVKLLPEISDAARAIILTTLAKDPALRHPNSEALVEDLNSALQGSTPVHARALRLKAFAESKVRPAVAKKVSSESSTESPAAIPHARTPNGLQPLPTSAVIGAALVSGIIFGYLSTGPSDLEKRGLNRARASATMEAWTNFIDRFPTSANIAEAQASLKLISWIPVVNTKPTINPQIIQLRAELRALDEQWLALNRGKVVTPRSTTVTPALVAAVLPETKPSETRSFPPRDISLAARPVESISDYSTKNYLKSLSPSELATFTIPENASRATAEAFINRIANSIPADIKGWMTTDNRVQALARIPAQQLPALLTSLENYTHGAMNSYIELAIPLVAQPQQADLILPLLGKYPELIKVVELHHWEAQAKPQILAWFKEKKDLQKVGFVASFVRVLVTKPDPEINPLLSEIFLRCEYGYWQRDIYYELEKVPGLDLDTMVATIWKRDGAYRGWEAFAPIAAQHGDADALAAVVARVPEHGRSHLTASKARTWLTERTDCPMDPTKAAAWLAAGPVYDTKRRAWYSKGSFVTP